MAGGRADDPVAGFFAEAAAIAAEVTGGAVADIRQKLVEEPWFGRAVTDKAPMAETLGWDVPASGSREWDALCDRLARERGSQVAPERKHDLDHEIGGGR